MEVHEAVETLTTTENGLSEQEAAERLEKYGPNKLVEEDRISRLKILLHQHYKRRVG